MEILKNCCCCNYADHENITSMIRHSRHQVSVIQWHHLHYIRASCMDHIWIMEHVLDNLGIGISLVLQIFLSRMWLVSSCFCWRMWHECICRPTQFDIYYTQYIVHKIYIFLKTLNLTADTFYIWFTHHLLSSATLSTPSL